MIASSRSKLITLSKSELIAFINKFEDDEFSISLDTKNRDVIDKTNPFDNSTKFQTIMTIRYNPCVE